MKRYTNSYAPRDARAIHHPKLGRYKHVTPLLNNKMNVKFTSSTPSAYEHSKEEEIVMSNLTNMPTPNLPATWEGVEAQRLSVMQYTDIGKMRAILPTLWPKPEFRALFHAARKDETVHGSLQMDDIRSLDAIIAYAHENGIKFAGNDADLLRTLRRVKAEFNMSRKDRKEAGLPDMTPEQVIQFEEWRRANAR